ncbi:MAG: hypothetical protein AB1664_09655 [Thermodesulfobacteriota bacterium]
MALFKDRVDPNVLVERAKAGALKSEIEKDYKISDEELAMILLPLYRKGELTKDQFNDFFRGLPIKPAPESAAQATEGPSIGDTVPEMAVAEEPEVEAEIVAEEPEPESELAPEPALASPPEVEEEVPAELEPAAQAPEPPAEKPQEEPPEPASRMDFRTLENILKRIWKRLDVIDRRLGEIEKKLPE